MADRGEQRLRKRMYKPKQFQKKKRIPRPAEGSAVNNTNAKQDLHPNSDEEVDVEDISTSASDEDSPAEQIGVAHESSVEHLLRQGSDHRAQQGEYGAEYHVAEVPRRDDACELEQFLLDVTQPLPAPHTGTHHPPLEHDTELSAWLDSIAIKK